MMVSARDGIAPDATNFYGSVIVLGDRGILIAGASGAGKSSLALGLVSRWRALGRFTRLVADDQVFVAARHGRLLAQVPSAISGLVEVRGIGPVPTPHQPAAVLDLAVELVDDAGLIRLGGLGSMRLHDIDLPLVRLARGRNAAAINAVELMLTLGCGQTTIGRL